VLVTRLTGVSLSVGFASGELLVVRVFGLCCCWSVLGRFGVVLLGFLKGSSSMLVLGSREVIEALRNICCVAAVAIGLTGVTG
jgi:hypothetical protein